MYEVEQLLKGSVSPAVGTKETFCKNLLHDDDDDGYLMSTNSDREWDEIHIMLPGLYIIIIKWRG